MNCKRCGTECGVYGRFTVGPRIDFSSWSRAIEMTDSPTAPGYCRDCAEKRQRELLRSDERSKIQRRFKESGAQNLHADDCTVAAVANATGVTYPEALAIAKRKGYRPNRGGVFFGTWSESLRIAAKRKGMIVETVAIGDCGRVSVEKFAKTFPKGRYAVRISGHAISIKNGKVFNASASDLRATVQNALRVRKATDDVLDQYLLQGVEGR